MNLPSLALQKAYFLALDQNVKNWDTVTYASNFTVGNEDLIEVDGTGGDGILIGDLKDVYRFTLDDSTGEHGIGITGILPTTETVKVEFDYFIPSGQTVTGLLVRTNDSGDGTYLQNVTGDWTSATITDWQNTNALEALIMYTNDGAGESVTAEGDVFYLKNLIVRTGQPVAVYDVVPPDTAYPYVVLTGQNVIETNFNTDKRITEIVTDVDVVTGFDGSHGGKKQMYEISDQVINIIRQVPGSYLSLDGFTMLTSTLDSTVSIQEQTDTNVLFINRLRFRHKIQEN